MNNYKYLYYNVICMFWRGIDFFVSKKKYSWAFATHHIHSTKLIENQRAIFEFVKNDSNIKKIIFYREHTNDLDIQNAKNVEFVRIGSFRAFYALLFCKVVFVSHSISMDYSIRFGVRDFVILKLNLRKRIIVNLWHGIPIKRLLYASNEETRKHTDRMPYRNYERKHYSGLIASSGVDGLIMAAMFYPLNYSQVWSTGLPRNDFLLKPLDKLPLYIKNSVLKLKEIKKEKRLIVYAPTYRQMDIIEDAFYYHFGEDEIKALKKMLIKHNAILGFRPHYFKNSKRYFNLSEFIDNVTIFDISQVVIPEFSAIARECDILVTDYSSVVLETLYLDKPSFCFAYDLENYKKKQDGLIYDLDMIFFNNVYEKFDKLLIGLESELSSNNKSTSQKIIKDFFFYNNDSNNSERVVRKVKNEVEMNLC